MNFCELYKYLHYFAIVLSKLLIQNQDMESPEPNQDSGFSCLRGGFIMFTVFEIGPWVIEADTAETRKQYEKSWPDPCDCGCCRNFSEAVNLLSAEKTRLFTQFGIRPAVCHDLGSMERKTACIIMRAAIRLSAGLGRLAKVSYREGGRYPLFVFIGEYNIFIPKGFPDPIIHLDFSLLLPWVLEEDAE